MYFNAFYKKFLKILSFLFILLTCFVIFAYSSTAKNNVKKGSFSVNNKTFSLEIADTDFLRERGLMYRTMLPARSGMIFIFDKPQDVGFWMKNVKISLDMVFILNSKIVKIDEDVPVCNEEPCDVYSSNGFIDTVVELNSGACKKYNIQVGQQVKFSNNIQSLINKNNN